VTYAYYDKAKKGQEWTHPEHHSMLFTVYEIDALSAVSTRQGQTLTRVIRSAWAGEPLGFAYKLENRVLLPRRTYRFAMVLAIQPKQAEPLFAEVGGGHRSGCLGCRPTTLRMICRLRGRTGRWT
jgi:hypothetical protein